MNADPQQRPGTNTLLAISQMMDDALFDVSSDQRLMNLKRSGFNITELREKIAAALEEAKGLSALAQARARRLSLVAKSKELIMRLPKINNPRAAIEAMLDSVSGGQAEFAVQFRNKLNETKDSELESLLEDIALAGMLDEDSK